MNSNEYIYGYHAIERALKQSRQNIKTLWVQQGIAEKRVAALINLAKKANIPVEYYPRQKLDEVSSGHNHQGIVACYQASADFSSLDLKEFLSTLEVTPFLLILDGVQDPHNLGACLRSANAAGVHAVIAPTDNAVGITPVVRKVACGAAELTPFIQVTNLANTLRYLKEQGIWIFGATEHTQETIYQMDLKGPIALALGAEGQGLRRLTSELCDFLFQIPTYGSIASLNVSVATGVCLFEAARQRHLS
jgi:23S rRNA (guanosine2251-2'-O)-methyltransferase